MAKVEAHESLVQDNAMHCAGCGARIQTILSRVAGVKEVRADHKTQRVHLKLDLEQISIQEVRQKLEEVGYKTVGSP